MRTLAIPEDRIIRECSSELMFDFISELSDFEIRAVCIKLNEILKFYDDGGIDFSVESRLITVQKMVWASNLLMDYEKEEFFKPEQLSLIEEVRDCFAPVIEDEIYLPEVEQIFYLRTKEQYDRNASLVRIIEKVEDQFDKLTTSSIDIFVTAIIQEVKREFNYELVARKILKEG